jgi:putative transposase
LSKLEPKEIPMQVVGLPGQVIRNAGAASRLLAAKTPDIAAAGRRGAVARWRRAMARGLSAAAAAEAVGVPRATLYRWEKRPELRSRRPRRVRGRRWTPALVAAVEGLRADNPVWGKRKLGPILRAQGFAASDATVGRILAHLVRLGRAVPAPLFRRPTRAAAQGRRRWARRLRGALKATRPGEAVQVDTLSLAFPGGRGVKQFTAVDRLSRWSVAMAAQRATAAAAARFLDKLVAELPFELRAIQIDGGSEFMAEFEAACEQKGVALHVLPPRSPELNGRVERLQGTWRYEFYAVYDPPPQIDKLNPLIDAFAHRYNTYRPHDALGQITPQAYLESLRAAETPPSHMC